MPTLAVLATVASLAAGPVAAANGPEGTPIDVLRFVVPVIGSTPGVGGSYFKTSLQLHNPNSASYSVRVVFHPTGASGQPGDPSLTLTVPAQATRYFSDLLPEMGVASGLGSLDVFFPVAETRTLVGVTRVYNDGGANGTTGFTEPAVQTDQAFETGDVLLLICSPDPSLFRFNVGVRTLSHGAEMIATVRATDGTYITSVNKTYPANYFRQDTVEGFLDGHAHFEGNESLRIQMTGGEAIIYGALVDNRTQDPSMAIAQEQ
jgi:hypothetical protein